MFCSSNVASYYHPDIGAGSTLYKDLKDRRSKEAGDWYPLRKSDEINPWRLEI